MKGHKHSFKVRIRAFHIWQVLGYNPWQSEWTVADDVPEGNVKGFYRGAFDSIPFLNDDAKRTFIHLLLRPGYMIRDYIKGKHDIYLAPLTSLIIFYAFFSLVSSIAHPEYEPVSKEKAVVSDSITFQSKNISIRIGDNDSIDAEMSEKMSERLSNLIVFFDVADTLTHLDKYPEAVNSSKKASLAAFESALRSQGINYFLGLFLLLWPAIRIAFRKHSMGWAASATTAAYILCQFSFFMLFVLIVSFGQTNEIGVLFMGILMLIDFSQLMGLGFKKSLWLTLKTGIWVGVIYACVFIVLVVATTVYIVV